MAGFSTLPARYFTDADLFRREMERFYFNRWICAGRADAIPSAGDYFLRDVAGESIIVTRDASVALRAFYNVCRHRGTRLCTEPEGNLGSRIVCPYHAWSYGLDGGLLNAPQMQISREQYPLHPVHVAVWDGHVFLHLGRGTPSLDQQLGPLPNKFAPWCMHELRLYKRLVYEVKANWKLAVLNYNECLHCPVVHPALNRLTDYLGANNDLSHSQYIGGSMAFRRGVETMTLDGLRRRDYLPGLGEIERKQVFYYAIFPNLLLSLHPDYMMVHTLWPRAADRTRIVCEFYFHPAELAKPGFVGDDAVEFWDQTNREDWRVVELSQLGIQSRAYTPGPYSQREELLHAFDEMVREEHTVEVSPAPATASRQRGITYSMSSTTLLALSALSLSALVAQPKGGFAQPAPPRDVTIAAIPGVIDAGAKWTPVWQGDATADGIVGTKDGGLLMAQEQTNQINKLDKNGKFSVFLKTPHGPGAVSIGPKGQLLAVERTCTDPGGHLGTKPEQCTEPTDVAALTPERRVLASSIDGKGLGRVNDLIADKKGGAYFTSGGAFYLSPGGKVSSVGDLTRTNGITLSTDEKTLYITNGPVVMAFDVQPDGSVKNQREFGKLEGGGNGDGMVIDAAGHLYVSTNAGIQVLDSTGKYLGIIPTPRNAITAAFSGPGKKTLYAGCMGALDANGKEFATSANVRNVAMTVYKIPMLAQGFKGRAK